MNILIGDLQGCCDAFERLLARLAFSPSRDRLYVLGDLVNRGPASLQVLERLQALEGSVHCLLGNHDLHLLAVSCGVRKPHRSDTLQDILASPRREAHLTWLRQQSMALQAHGWLMVHAGVVPPWTAADAVAWGAEVEACLRSADWVDFLHEMYGNDPARWDDGLTGTARLRLIVNVLTRLRFCTADGTMDFQVKEGADAAPPGLMPWFDAPGRRTAGQRVAFGHWSTLGPLARADLLALDTGCVWGGSLTAAVLDDEGAVLKRVAVACAQAQRPGS